MLENFETDVAVYKTSYWRFLIGEKNLSFFIFIAFLNSLQQEDYIAQKRRKKHAQKYVFALKFSSF